MGFFRKLALRVISLFDKNLRRVLIMNGMDFEISQSKISQDLKPSFTPLEKLVEETKESLGQFEEFFE